MDRAPVPPAEAAAPSGSTARRDLSGDALLQSEEFVAIALACFAAGVKEAVTETDALKKASRPTA